MIDRQKIEWILEDFHEEGSTQTLEDTIDRIEQAVSTSAVQKRITALAAIVGDDRLLEALDLAIEAAKAAGRPPVIDLNDPVSENAVAEAIRRLAPEGAYVPLSVRYPWRFSDYTATGQQTTIVDAVAEALRGSAAVHEAEHLPHLVDPLIALAEALEHGALVPGPPPGRCASRLVLNLIHPDGRGGTREAPEVHSCVLLSGHRGLHREVEPTGLPAVEWDDTSAEHRP